YYIIIYLQLQHHHHQDFQKDKPIISAILPLPVLGICIKYGITMQLCEAANLRYIAENTTIPVPKVYSSFRERGITYIVMEWEKGEEIGKNWETRAENIFDHLRNLPHSQPGFIAAAGLQPAWDPTTFKDHYGLGPFANDNDFNASLRYGLRIAFDMIHMQDQEKHKVYFTHGDVSSSNILVRDGKVVGLVDWEMAGWFQEYWEYTTSMNVNRFDEFWKEEIPQFLQAYPR
ncbi:kinase-like domain-containing protein, partial [Halenospora varia]